ncbi:hypothetical protein HYH03_007395 [Edaphochlamys debaryana]|uniref:Uncharacterized protein n=1 Tax=Edaphochlamys debaryana TaxID=47281 RepID=A0A836BZV0_9CHLO|nr:hypothetical protein HYH03_007395 [Edaphochlamys debaryana]|eukprot:KAG2494337.1 hypothetical protein HYH03_007395 [Edaphochlamys debaryana]
MASAAPRVAVAAAGAGGVGMLFSSWIKGDTQPANLPSHPHNHHGYADAVGIKNLKEGDIAHEAPTNVANSGYALAESYVGPADPVNSKKSFEPPHQNLALANKLEIGVETRANNSVFGLLNSWFGSSEAKR